MKISVKELLGKECIVGYEPFEDIIKAQSKTNCPFIVSVVIQKLKDIEHTFYINPIALHDYFIVQGESNNSAYTNPINRNPIDKIVYLALNRKLDKESLNDEVSVHAIIDFKSLNPELTVHQQFLLVHTFVTACQTEDSRARLRYQLLYLHLNRHLSLDTSLAKNMIDSSIEDVNNYFLQAIREARSVRDLFSISAYGNDVEAACIHYKKELEVAHAITSLMKEDTLSLLKEFRESTPHKALAFALEGLIYECSPDVSLRSSEDAFNCFEKALVECKQNQTCVLSEASKSVSSCSVTSSVVHILGILGKTFQEGNEGFQQDDSRACRYYEIIQKIDPNNLISLSGLADIYRFGGEGGLQQAITYLKKAELIDSNHINTLSSLGDIYRVGGVGVEPDMALALAYLQRAEMINPNDQFTLCIIGEVYRTGGNDVEKNLEKSLVYLNKAQSRDPSDPFILSRLASIYLEYYEQEDEQSLIEGMKSLKLEEGSSPLSLNESPERDRRPQANLSMGLNYLRQAKQYDPDDQFIVELLEKVYTNWGITLEADQENHQQFFDSTDQPDLEDEDVA